MGGVAWSEEEDNLLRKCIGQYGEGKWHRIPLLAGINRCRKSCRLRWLNYLRPNIRRGKFTDEEVDLIIKLHNLLGNRWSLIAGRLPGRTANDVKNYWHCHLSKRLNCHISKSNATTKNATQEQVMESSKDLLKGHAQEIFHVASVSTNEILPCVQNNFINNNNINNNVIIGQSKEVNEDMSNMTLEELSMDLDFDLEEIKISGSDHRKYNWNFDDLLFDMEL